MLTIPALRRLAALPFAIGSLIGSTLLTTACGESTSPTPVAVDSLTALPRTLTATERDAIAGTNQFALTLLKQTSIGGTANVLLSPLSVSLALGMTMNGAAGETESQMSGTLGWSGRSRTEVNSAYRDLAALLPSLDSTVTVKLANGIWVRAGVAADTGFQRDVQQFFGAGVRSASTPQAMFDAVNAWGNTQTNGMVPRVLSSPPPDDLVMLLANAVFFDGRWRDAFDPKDTGQDPFHLEGSSAPVSVPMMKRKGVVRFAGAPTHTAIELSYGNTAYSMLILVPYTGTVDQLVARLDPAFLDGVVASLRPTYGNEWVYLPKFTVRASKELSGTLSTMGMPRAFSDLAEFPRLIGSAVKLGFVQHGVTLEVNERGTRAAAVTVVGVVPVSAPPSLRVDRPFVFFIRERFAGTILFTGVIRDPRQ